MTGVSSEQQAFALRAFLAEHHGHRFARAFVEFDSQANVVAAAFQTAHNELPEGAFALLQKLELDAPLKAPSVLTVFRLYGVDGFSADRVARKCRCAKGTVMNRLRVIEERTGVKPEQFRAMSGHLQHVDDELNASAAREIYRRRLANDES